MDDSARLQGLRARLYAAPGVAHRVGYIAAAIAIAFSFVVSLIETNDPSGGEFVTGGSEARSVGIVIPIIVVGLGVLWRRSRPLVYAAGAGVMALYTSGGPWLAAAVGGMVFVSILGDRARTPLVGWGLGLAGSVLGTYAFVDGAWPLGFYAVAIGGGLAFMLRTALTSQRLVGEARELRVEAGWIEQRTSIARELHDVVGHHVTAMVVQAEAGQVSDPQAALRAIGDLGRTALGELDALVVHLRDPSSPVLVTAPARLSDIDELLAAPLRQMGVAVTVDLEPELAMDEALVATVYRIVQESITNITRHARADQAWVEVTRAGPGQVRVRVSDDGVGMPPAAQRQRGAGLVGIEERVRGLKGFWSITGRPGGGTMLEAVLPLRTAP